MKVLLHGFLFQCYDTIGWTSDRASNTWIIPALAVHEGSRAKPGVTTVKEASLTEELCSIRNNVRNTAVWMVLL